MCTFACVWEKERIGFPPHLTWAGFFVIFIYFILVMPGGRGFQQKRSDIAHAQCSNICAKGSGYDSI